MARVPVSSKGCEIAGDKGTGVPGCRGWGRAQLPSMELLFLMARR